MLVRRGLVAVCIGCSCYYVSNCIRLMVGVVAVGWLVVMLDVQIRTTENCVECTDS